MRNALYSLHRTRPTHCPLIARQSVRFARIRQKKNDARMLAPSKEGVVQRFMTSSEEC